MRVLLLWLLWAGVAQADNWRLFELRLLSMDAWRIADSYDGYFPYAQNRPGVEGEHWDKGAAINFDYDLIKYKGLGLYWDNKVWCDSTNRAVRQVAWDWEAGVQLHQDLTVYHAHTSRHVLDELGGDKHYPLRNVYGVRYVFFRRAD